jgi:hypothetical protein
MPERRCCGPRACACLLSFRPSPPTVARAYRKLNPRIGPSDPDHAAAGGPSAAFRPFPTGPAIHRGSNAAQRPRRSDMNAPHRDDGFFTESLESRDPEIFGAIEKELGRQRDEIELIASENIVSAAVMAAQGSVMTNKYAEGYPGPPLLWRLRICRHRREPRHRPGQGALRGGVRQRAAQFRQPGQPGRVPGAAATRATRSSA